MPDLPLLVFGPRSLTYDFGSSHPLTPRRFGPGIDLLRLLGAEPGLAPEPAPDEELLTCHSPRYLEVVKRFSEADLDPWGESEAGIGPGDDPPFHGMHEAGATVAGGSLRAMDAILRGDVLHAFHPGGGLHHAMRSRAGGFCIYNDVALAVARARAAGLRVMYIDLDVHHGDGVEAIHAADPGVLTVSIHETGRYLFPGTGFQWETGEGEAAGTVVNVPLEPETGEEAWLNAVSTAASGARCGVRARDHRQPARLRHARDRIRSHTSTSRRRRWVGRRASSTSSPTSGRAGGGWPPAAAATTCIGSWRAPGPTSGSRVRIARFRTPCLPSGWSGGRPRRRGTANGRSRRPLTTRPTPACR